MNTLTLQAAQNDIVRSVLNINSLDTLNKVKRLLHREKQKQEEATADICFSDEEVLQSFDNACKEFKLYKEGKVELKSLEEALNEL